MTKRTLLAKIDRPSHLNQIERTLKRFLEDLEAKAEIIGVVADRWPQIDISGEDEGIATNYIAREIGFCPEKLQSIEKYQTLKGYVTSLKEDTEGLKVDVGIFEPSTVTATVPLSHLQAQLTNGKEFTNRKMEESYGLCTNLPIQLKIISINPKERHIEAELSTGQISKYKSWIESLMDRLIIIGATHEEIQKTLNYTGLKRDVIDVELLGIFEHALTCKLGTDAVGLVSIVGRRLRNAKVTVFSPRRLWKI